MALLLYLWFAFFRPQDWMWYDITSLRPSLVLGLVLLIPSVFSGILPNLTHPLSIGCLLFLLSTLTAQFNAVNAQVGWEWIDFLARLILVSLLTISLITTPRRLLGVVAVVAGSLGFYATKAGLLSLVTGGLRFADGLAGAFIDNNGYALGTVMIMPLFIALAENLELLIPPERPLALRWIRRGLYLGVPLCGFTVISTFSRAGFLALAAATLFYVALHRYRIRLALALSALITLGLVFVPIPDGYVERLQTIQTYEEIEETSAMSRPHFWQVALQMVDAEPLGVGLRNYDYAYDAYDFSHGKYGSGRSVHSSHFQVLAEQGYFGAAVWIGQFICAFLVARRVRARASTPGLVPAHSRFLTTLANALLASMAGFLVGGSFIALALNDVTWITFALLAALDRISTQLCAEATPAPALTAAAALAPALNARWRSVRPTAAWPPARNA